MEGTNFLSIPIFSVVVETLSHCFNFDMIDRFILSLFSFTSDILLFTFIKLNFILCYLRNTWGTIIRLATNFCSLYYRSFGEIYLRSLFSNCTGTLTLTERKNPKYLQFLFTTIIEGTPHIFKLLNESRHCERFLSVDLISPKPQLNLLTQS